MRRLFIIQIVCCLIFSPFQSLALVGDATRFSTGIISSISSSGGVYGGASGSKIVCDVSRSFAGGYAASPLGTIPAGAAGGYEATAAVALSRGATGGLLRLGLQAGKCLGWIGVVITAAQLAGMAWEWYQDQEGKGHFVKSSGDLWRPVPGGYIVASASISMDNPWPSDSGSEYNGKTLFIYNCKEAFDANHPPFVDGRSGVLYYSGSNCTQGGCTTKTIDFSTLFSHPISSMFGFTSSKTGYSYCIPSIQPPPDFVPQKIPVPWDDVQKAIEDDLTNRPNEWADPFSDAVKEVPPAVNPWLDETAKEDAAKPAPNPMPENLPYPTPSGTPSVPNPATGEPMPAPLPNELTKEDISKVASEILKSLSPSQSNNVSTGDVTQPTPNQDLANQLSSALAAKIPQPPYDVKVINEPTIKIKTEDSWKGDAESAVGSETQPDSNEDLDINLDLEKYKSKKRDLSFLDTIYSNIKSLPIFTLFQKTPISVSGGSSEICLDIPKFGKHCINLNTYSSEFETVGSVCVAICFFTCLAIIFL